MSDNGRTARAWLWGLLVGGAVGFGVGLITAPEEGRKVRRRLAYQLDHLGEKVSDLVDEYINTDQLGEAQKAGKALVADAEQKAKQIRADIDNLLGEMKQHRKAG